MAMLAVVPIFMGAGAALMPTILAAIASVAVVIFKPRELIRLCRSRPITSITTIAVLMLIVGISTWRLGGSRSARAAASTVGDARAKPRFDWSKVAADLIAQEKAGKQPTTFVSVPTESNAPWIEAHDASRTSYAGGPSPTGLKPFWAYKPDGTMFLSAPAVSGKRIVTAGCQSDLGGYTGILACLDADTGKPVWEVTAVKDDILPPFFSSPALTADGKSLLIGQGLHQDRNCSLLCFDVATGTLRWAVKTPLHIESSPAIFGDMAVVGAGAIEGTDGRAMGDPGFVLAVRISDGKELWRQAVNDPESSPAFDENGMVYIGSGFNGNAVVAIRSESAEALKEKKLDRVAWKTPVPHPITGAITLSGDMVFAGGGNSDVVHSNADPQGVVVAIDRKTGQIKWQTPFRDSVLSGVAAHDGMLICPVRTGEVVALSQADGKILWHTSISGKAAVIASCAFTGEKIYAVSSDGYLAVLDPKSGAVLEKCYINDQGKAGSGLSTSPPQVVDGRVIVGSETGGLQCLVGAAGGAGVGGGAK